MNETHDQLAYLSDADLAVVYHTSRKLLKQRNLLENLNDNFYKKKLSNSTLQFKRIGKVIRNNKSSILPDILDEDWTFLFANYKRKCDNNFYVYIHLDPNKPYVFNKGTDRELRLPGKPFYVGKGTNGRAYSLTRSKSHLNIVNSLICQGKTINDIVYIFKNDLTEIDSLILESKLISFFGSRNECDPRKAHLTGEKGGWLINSDIPPRPDWINEITRKL